jgi:uncharacterized protein (TIGR03663 family)
MSRIVPAITFLGLVALASALRLPLLAERPMHCDEAVHADKFGILLEQGRYEYSTVDFHGPTLYYLSLIPARIRGVARYVDLNETMLRSVPAMAGILLVAAHIFLIPYIGFRAAACAGLLASVSPAMVYYSRYYIHEMVLILLTLCAFVTAMACWRNRSTTLALGTGVFLGLMYSTKETAVLSVGCMLLAVMTILVLEGGRKNAWIAFRSLMPVRKIVLAVAAAILVSFILLSSFLSHPRGVLDSILAYRTYLERGSGIKTFHVHPWMYYFRLLLYNHADGGPVWTEALIVILAVAGFWAAFSGKAVSSLNPTVLRFFALYTLFMTAIYAIIPYKAPWNLLGFLHGMILLAGIGIVWLAHSIRKNTTKVAFFALVTAGVVQLASLAWASSVQYGADPSNPWVYAHTGNDVFLIMNELEALASVHPERRSLPVQIISRENLWPLPWYLRRFPGVRWWNGVSDTAPVAPVILATPDMEPGIVRRLYDLPPPGRREMYVSMFDKYIELRPRVELRGYVLKSLWDALPPVRSQYGLYDSVAPR